MAESIEKTKQYKYQVNANLVITRDNTGPRDAVHTTGESSTLSVHPFEKLRSQFGIGAKSVKNEEIDRIKKEHKEKKKKNQDTHYLDASSLQKYKRRNDFSQTTSVLDQRIDATYRPTTEDSRAAYEAIINFVGLKFPSAVCFVYLFLLYFIFAFLILAQTIGIFYFLLLCFPHKTKKMFVYPCSNESFFLIFFFFAFLFILAQTSDLMRGMLVFDTICYCLF